MWVPGTGLRFSVGVAQALNPRAVSPAVKKKEKEKEGGKREEEEGRRRKGGEGGNILMFPQNTQQEARHGGAFDPSIPEAEIDGPL